LFVTFDVSTDLPAPIISNPNHRMAYACTRQEEHCREQPR
jgi:hypothetical protein